MLLLTIKTSLNKANTVFSALLLPLSTINGLFFIFYSDWKATFAYALVCCGCSIVMLVKYASPIALKITAAILSILLILFLLFFAYFDFIFEDFGWETVVKSVTSPKNTYIAEVIASDQGALGGDTFVDVRNNSKPINLFIFNISKSPIRVYSGHWGEFKNMKISWKDEHTLIINSKEYFIND